MNRKQRKYYRNTGLDFSIGFANFRFQLNFCKKRLSQVFFFQLLTATSENSSTRLEKRLENSKSAKFESDLLKKI